MSHARIETSVPRHPKFLRAGPAASWLWFCGACYSFEHRTGGFVSVQALDTFGIPAAHRLTAVLVAEGLWTPAEGGWLVNTERIRLARRRRSIRHLFQRVVAWWGRACVYCGLSDAPLEIEHIVPVARGGTDDPANLTIACRPCNLSKGTLTAAEFGHPEVHERAKGIH